MVDTLHVDVEKTPLVYIPKIGCIVARQQSGKVLLFLDHKCVELSTTIAHGVGMAIFRAERAPDEMVVLTINGERIELLWPMASRLAVGLLRKADAADDWQLMRKAQ